MVWNTRSLWRSSLLAAVAAAVLSPATGLRLNGWYPCTLSEPLPEVPFASLIVFECGQVEVPLCHPGICDSNKTIEVFVKRMLAKNGSTHAHGGGASTSDSSSASDSSVGGEDDDDDVEAEGEPTKSVWFLEGGPGASSEDMELAMLSVYSLANASVNVYTMDHRGTGRSHFLECEAAQAFANGSPRGEELTLSEFPACIDDLMYQIDGQVAAFSVTSAATDIMHLIDSFHQGEGDEVFLYGSSYGTYLVERVMHLAPDKVQGYVLDGVVSESGATPSTRLQFSHWNLNIIPPSKRFFELCYDQEDCPLTFKEKDTVLEEVLAMYKEIDANIANNSCAATLMFVFEVEAPSYALRAFLGLLVRDARYRSLVPSLLARIHRCNDRDIDELSIVMDSLLKETFGAYAAKAETRYAPSHSRVAPLPRPPFRKKKQSFPGSSMFLLGSVESTNPLVYFLIAYSELWSSPVPSLAEFDKFFLDGVFSEDALNIDIYCLLTGNLNAEKEGHRREQVCDEVLELLKPASGSLSLGRETRPFVYEKDQYWNRTAPLPAHASALFFVGGLDFQTPKEFALVEFDGIKSAMEGNADQMLMLVEFEFGAHGAGLLPTTPEDETNCGARIMTSFILNGGDTAQVDTSCIDELPRLSLTDKAFLDLVDELENGVEIVVGDL